LVDEKIESVRLYPDFPNLDHREWISSIAFTLEEVDCSSGPLYPWFKLYNNEELAELTEIWCCEKITLSDKDKIAEEILGIAMGSEEIFDPGASALGSRTDILCTIPHVACAASEEIRITQSTTNVTIELIFLVVAVGEFPAPIP